ncbi:SubName: Full=Uncharacterized protein {ECO:0000313/EMBL:CCA68776.1} [Serendipita indica DSM 11827]|uniref:Uncharacterized protein n=1 Tax=Serendipita indica (strain DSM 11827) TaxID=1109443 RepID=G4TBT2_SERID|nr:SubName: Full=Uncharacterized protein {ECO:0000313/EMBL:CCA68776.1} [Serendipita indica DSM 11827]CCA68776.1 hypothetical protein PIIN_02638 [Serendipita indica DSM 11827]
MSVQELQLHDNIYGREIIITNPRKLGSLFGRGGYNRLSAASGSVAGSSVLSMSSSQTRTADRDSRQRRWSSASSDFQSVVNIAHEVGHADRSDLQTISSYSTNASSAVLSDIPSFISEYTFNTGSHSASNASHSRPATLSSDSFRRRSMQSEWHQSRASYSQESLPLHLRDIPGSDDDDGSASVMPSRRPASPPESIQFLNPFAWDSDASIAMTRVIYNPDGSRRPSVIAPFEEPPPDVVAPSVAASPQRTPSKTSRKFSIFKNNKSHGQASPSASLAAPLSRPPARSLPAQPLARPLPGQAQTRNSISSIKFGQSKSDAAVWL